MTSPETAPLTKVMIFGTFDLLHYGHEDVLRQARLLGNYLIAVVARDETVRKLKGFTPHHSEKDRIKNLKKLSLIDKVVLGNLGDKYTVIKEHKPDVIALGYDQFAFTFRLEKLLIDEHLSTEIHRLKAFQPHLYKSSLLRANLQQRTHQPLETAPAIPFAPSLVSLP